MPYIIDNIEDYQCRFMNGITTIDHIFSVKQFHYEFDKALHMLFIDYKQTYV